MLFFSHSLSEFVFVITYISFHERSHIMKVNGIVAEYNPFHNGHAYQLQHAKEANDADYTIIVMSGNFMQRGAPALLDKFTRTKMALVNGADLVLELPTCYAASSAEFFAKGSVALFDKLGVTTNLCFGSECGNIEVLSRIAEIFYTEPEPYVESLRCNMRKGMSFPIARTWALLQYAPSLSNDKDVLSSPNNILGIEYLKALMSRSSKISPFTTTRVGADYHDKRLGTNQCSAIAIRQSVAAGHDLSYLAAQMPESAYALMTDSLSHKKPLFADDFSAALQYKLLTEYSVGYDKYQDISSDLSDRIRNTLPSFAGYTSFCDLLKSKDMTYTRISRCLLHILLNMTKEEFETCKSEDYISYARVLGFRKNATPLLAEIKKNSSIPLVTSLADARQTLSPESLRMLDLDILRNQIYLGNLALKNQTEMVNEYRTPIVIV